MLWLFGNKEEEKKKVSASLTGFYVCISSMTGYTCPKAPVGILFVICLLEVHHRSYDFSINTKIFHALSKRPNFLSFLKSDISCFCHSFSVSPAGQSLCLVRRLHLYKTGLTVFSNILPVLSTENTKFWSPGTILNFINIASSMGKQHISWSLQ